MILRARYEERITTALRRSPMAALIGPRRVGKTTLARLLAAARPSTYFDLESVPDLMALLGHPKVGASWEGSALEQPLALVRPGSAYFWATHGGAELDLLFTYRGKRCGVEAMFSEAPTRTRSMRIALANLELEHLWIVHSGPRAYPLAERIDAVPPVQAVATLTRELT